MARLHRARELTAVWVPDPAHEAMRDLVRARMLAVEQVRRARQHVQSFLLRHGRVYSGRAPWTAAHRGWLAAIRFDHTAHQIVFQEFIDAVADAERRRDRLTEQVERLLPEWSLAPVVAALQAMRGVAFITAVTLGSEVGCGGRRDEEPGVRSLRAGQQQRM
ncbi:Mobile element protein [Azospirillum melinis]